MFSVHHISISVKDPEESKRFYETLGFKEIFRWSSEDGNLTIIHLKLSDIFLEIFSFKNSKEKPDFTENLWEDLKVRGIKHFALKVDDINKTREFFIKKGIISDKIEITEGKTGILYFFIKDPDGIFIEIVEDKRDINVKG
ncbi:VOC family protein [Persephonella sp.]